MAGSEDFKNFTNQTTEYTYNKNGALTKDLNKGITEIRYNSVHLPRQMDIKSPLGEARNEYVYAASGVKLQVIQRYNSAYSKSPVIGSAVNTTLMDRTKKTDYVGSDIYEEGKLIRTLIDGGYYDVSEGKCFFYLTDHLGNVRVVADEQGADRQVTHYYPFGSAFMDGKSPGLQPYKYNGKEQDKMHGLNLYDYHARHYDSAIDRFTTIDPLAEKYYSISPYVYVANNPMKYIDPDGKEVVALNKGARQAILNTLPKSIRSFVIFNKNGSINKIALNSVNSTSENFLKLSQLVNNNQVFEVNVSNKMTYKNEKGSLIDLDMGPITLTDDKHGSFGFNTGEEGWQGVTQTPGNNPDKYNSPNDKVKIVINSGLTLEGQAQIFAHEAYGHAFLYSTGRAHTHQVKNTSEGFKETNKILLDAIVRAIKETIENMK